MEYKLAKKIAENLVERMRPACSRIEIAGSIRREKPEVKDIEIVATPILKAPRPVFGQLATFNTPLNALLFEMLNRHELAPIKGKDKYRKFHVFPDFDDLNPIALDLFLVTPPAQWGVLMVIRTGPNKLDNNFSQWMVTQKSKGGALPDEYIVADGVVGLRSQDDKRVGEIETPEEIDFFKLCGMDYIEPNLRQANWKRQ